MTCGHGEDCGYSGFLRQYGPGTKVTPDNLQDLNHNTAMTAKAQKLSEAVGRAARGINQRGSSLHNDFFKTYAQRMAEKAQEIFKM